MRMLERTPGKQWAAADASQPMRSGEAAFCANCGEKLRAGAKFCHNCGMPVAPVQYLAEPEPAAASPAPQEDADRLEPFDAEPPTQAQPAVSEPPSSAIESGQTPPRASMERRRVNGGTIPRWVLYGLIGVAALLLLIAAFGLGRCTGGGDALQPDLTATPVNAEEQQSAVDPAPADAAKQTGESEAPDLPSLDAEGKDSDGMKLPVPGEGETLYLGMLDYEEAELSKIAFVLSADGTKVHDITIFCKNLSLDFKDISTGISNLTVTESYQASYGTESFDRIDLGDSSLSGLLIDGDAAYADLDYVYRYQSYGADARAQVFALGVCSVEFARVAGASRASASSEETLAMAPAAENPAAASRVPISFEGKTYSVGIGAISTDESGNRTVEIVGSGIGEVLPIRNGVMIVPIQASIESAGKTLGWSSASTSRGSIVFTFETAAEPELIYLYSFEDLDNESAWAVYDTTLTGFIEEY